MKFFQDQISIFEQKCLAWLFNETDHSLRFESYFAKLKIWILVRSCLVMAATAMKGRNRLNFSINPLSQINQVNNALASMDIMATNGIVKSFSAITSST